MSFVSRSQLGFECEGVTGYLRVEVAYRFAACREMAQYFAALCGGSDIEGDPLNRG